MFLSVSSDHRCKIVSKIGYFFKNKEIFMIQCKRLTFFFILTLVLANFSYAMNRLDYEAQPRSASKSESFTEKVRITPYVLAMTYSGNGLNNVEANPGFGLRVDADLNRYVSFGIGIRTVSLEANDLQCTGSFGMNCFGGNMGMGGFAGGGVGQMGNPSWNQFGRSIAMDNLQIDLNSRINVVRRERFTGYLGLGIGYNRMNLEFQDQFNYGQFGQSAWAPGMGMNPFMDREFTTTFFTGRVALGGDYYFTNMFGINLEFGYARGIANPNDRTNAPGFQMMLENIADQIAGANVMTAQLGVIIAF